MGPMLKKDLLVFWRDRKEILMALLLPIGIIAILSFVLSGMFDSEESPVNVDAALVIEDSQDSGVEHFANQVEESQLSESERERLLMQASQFNPTTMLEEFLNHPDLSDWLNIEKMNKEEATEKIKAGELHAAVYIPSGFTASFLAEVLLDESSEATIQVLAEETSTERSTLGSIVGSYVESMNLQLAVQQLGQTEMVEPQLPEGGTEHVAGSDSDPFNIVQYFTLAIGSLFALFISQTVATKTIAEKREQVFNRILLTNYPPIYFLLGKIASAFVFVWLQLVITILVIQMFFDVFPNASAEFWLGLLLAITGLALAVGGLTGIFTSLTLKMNDPDAINGIATVIIMTFGALGGGFFPIMFLPNFLQHIGIWTPNGKFLVSILEWVQQPALEDLTAPLLYFVGFFLVSLVIALVMFPRRGRNE